MITEDPRQHGLTAADLREAADLMYQPGDQRAAGTTWTYDEQVRRGRIRSRLRGLADAIDASCIVAGQKGV